MEAAGLIALIALATVVGSLAYLHLAPTGLSPIRDPVSRSGITAYRGGYRVATIAFAVAGVALAIGIQRRGLGSVATVIALLVIFSVARLLISWFPMDAPGTERTQTGQIHGLLALLTFGSVAFCALDLGRKISQQQGGALGYRPAWDGLAPVSTGLGWAMIVVLLAMGLSRAQPVLRVRFGLIERGFYALAIGWFLVFGVASAANVS